MEQDHVHIVGLKGNEVTSTAVLVPEGKIIEMQRCCKNQIYKTQELVLRLIFCEEYAKTMVFILSIVMLVIHCEFLFKECMDCLKVTTLMKIQPTSKNEKNFEKSINTFAVPCGQCCESVEESDFDSSYIHMISFKKKMTRTLIDILQGATKALNEIAREVHLKICTLRTAIEEFLLVNNQNL